MDKKGGIQQFLSMLQLTGIQENLDSILRQAEQENKSYQHFVYDLFKTEIEYRQCRATDRRFKQSGLYSEKTIEDFDFTFQTSITQREVNQLLEFEWLSQAFNLVFLGPPGVGKTHTVVLKNAQLLRRVKKADLVIIGELGYRPSRSRSRIYSSS